MATGYCVSLFHWFLRVVDVCVFFFNQKTAYELRISDWSSDVCSSDLTDLGRINRHIIPLIGKMLVTRLTKADVTTMMKDIMAGKTRQSEKTGKLRGRSIVRGGHGVANRTVGLLGGILSYARDELGIIEINPAHGVRKPKDSVRTRRLNEDEYRALGRILENAALDDRYTRTTEQIGRAHV